MPRGVYMRTSKKQAFDFVKTEEPVSVKTVSAPAKSETAEEMMTRLAEKLEEKASRYRRAVRVLRGEEGDC